MQDYIQFEATDQDFSDRLERNAKFNGVIQNVRYQGATKVTLWPEFAWFAKFSIAMRTPVVMELASNDPTSYGRFAEQKIVKYPLAKRTLCHFSAAGRTGRKPGIDDRSAYGKVALWPKV